MTTTRRSMKWTELFDMTFIQKPKMEITQMIFIKGNLQYAAIRSSMKHTEYWKNQIKRKRMKECNNIMLTILLLIIMQLFFGIVAMTIYWILLVSWMPYIFWQNTFGKLFYQKFRLSFGSAFSTYANKSKTKRLSTIVYEVINVGVKRKKRNRKIEKC